jgi:hypothetical protein
MCMLAMVSSSINIHVIKFVYSYWKGFFYLVVTFAAIVNHRQYWIWDVLVTRLFYDVLLFPHLSASNEKDLYLSKPQVEITDPSNIVD